MEVQIIDNQADIVRVSTPFGDFTGIWCSLAPVVYKRYTVELDCDDVLTLDMVVLANSYYPCIKNVDQAINIIGLVEEIQDEIMILRLHNNIMMLKVAPDLDFEKYIGQYVCIRLSEIKLFDIGIY